MHERVSSLGNLIFNDYNNNLGDHINGGGTINVTGNLQVPAWIDNGSSVTIALMGTSPQTITQTNDANVFPSETLQINDSGSSVSLASAVNAPYTGWSVPAGTLYMSGYDLTIPSLSLSGTTVHKKNSSGTGSAGTLDVNNSDINNGSDFGGTIAN